MPSQDPQKLGYAGAPVALRTSRRRFLRAVMAGVGLGAGSVWYFGREPQPALPAPPPPPPPPIARLPETRPVPVESEQVRIERVYNESIVPLLASFELRNGAAVGRAMGMLHDRVEYHRRHVGPFTRDISSWSTRFGVLKRYPSDLWGKLNGNGTGGKVAAYVNEKFRQHILSEQTLRQDVVAVVAQFNNDMAASRNQLYAELTLPLNRIKTIRPAQDVSAERIQMLLRDRAEALAGGLAGNTVAAGLVEFSAGWLAMDAAQAVTARVVGQILARVGTAMAAEGIAAGGATVEATAAGGGAGSFGGPLGTIVGIGVGLIIGVIVDWRLSKVFEAKISQQCNRFLDDLERQTRDGAAPGTGLRATLLDATKLMNQAQAEAVQNALKVPA